jgi:hypothetical protein
MDFECSCIKKKKQNRVFTEYYYTDFVFDPNHISLPESSDIGDA